jgi:hypothetical protein
VDLNIEDANGYNAEVCVEEDGTGCNLYTYRTNIGNSLTKGLEIFLQANISELRE